MAGRLAADRVERDPGGALLREAEDAGRDAREGDRGEAGVARQLEAARVAAREELVLAPVAAGPDRADGVDHVTRRQPEAGRHDRVAGRTRAGRSGRGRQLRTGRPMDRAIDPAAAGQAAVRGVDDGIEVERRDVGDDDLEVDAHAGPARRRLARAPISVSRRGRRSP